MQQVLRIEEVCRMVHIGVLGNAFGSGINRVEECDRRYGFKNATAVTLKNATAVTTVTVSTYCCHHYKHVTAAAARILPPPPLQECSKEVWKILPSYEELRRGAIGRGEEVEVMSIRCHVN